MTKFRENRRNLSQLIAAELLEQIRSGKLVPGQRLPTQRDLMEEFGVGANAVREATQALVMMSVIDIRPGRGAVVIGMPADSAMSVDTVAALLEDQAIADLFEFRQLVEVEIAGRASERAESDDIDCIRDAHEKFRAELVLGNSVYRADIAFHRALARATQNVVYVNVLDALGDLLAIARQRTEGIAGTKDKALAEHEHILEAVVHRDPAKARVAMTDHLNTVLTAIDEIKRPLNTDSPHSAPPQVAAPKG
jgi:GntR family transcriptional repressor for pyruvate dehydrogenase complex